MAFSWLSLRWALGEKKKKKTLKMLHYYFFISCLKNLN